MTLTDQLVRDEGIRLKLYQDTRGKWTIGVGRDLSDVGISEAEAMVLLANDVQEATKSLQQAFPWTTALDDVRFGALANMCFNLGVGGLSGFRLFLAAMQQGNWEEAKTEMLDSAWAEQVGARAQRLALQIETGIWQ
jgi:lysozyme